MGFYHEYYKWFKHILIALWEENWEFNHKLADTAWLAVKPMTLEIWICQTTIFLCKYASVHNLCVIISEEE